MDIYAAREIVYGFADIQAAGVPLIPNEASLPWPKDKIRRAFDVFSAAMEAERSKDPVTFAQDGYEETLVQALTMVLHIDDYHAIEECDLEAVGRANRLRRGEAWDDEVMHLLSKYPIGGKA